MIIWGSWGNAEAEAKPHIAVVQKPCCIEATCRLSYEALVEAINACLPQNKSKSSRSTRPARTFQLYFLHYLSTHEKLNYSQANNKFAVVSDVVLCVTCLIYAHRNVQVVGEILFTI